MDTSFKQICNELQPKNIDYMSKKVWLLKCFLYACRLKSKFVSTILTVMQEGNKFVEENASQGLKTKFITGYICYIVDQLL